MHPPLCRRPLRLEALESRLAPAAAGSLDHAFSADGLAALGFDLGGTNADAARAVAALPDGRLLVVGSADAGRGNTDFVLARLYRDGSPDLSFGNAGRVRVPFDLGGSNVDVATAVAARPDGSAVVAGYADTAGDSLDFVACKLLPDGRLDPSFGTAGKARVGFAPGSADRCLDLAVLPDGRLALAGGVTVPGVAANFGVALLSSAGLPDATFGTSGLKVVAFDLTPNGEDVATAVAAGPGGTVLVAGRVRGAGSDPGEFAVARLTAAGALDAAFGAAGKATLGFGSGSDDDAEDLAVLPDGRIVVAGSTSGAAGVDFGVARLTAAGLADATFSDDGRATVAFDLGGDRADRAEAVAVQPDGKVIVAGSAAVSATGNDDMAVARLLPSGAADLGFGAAGKARVALDVGGTLDDLCMAVAVTADGIVLAGSGATAAGGADFAVVRLVRDPWVIASADAGGPPVVRVLTPTGTLLHEAAAYGPAFRGGVRVAAADFTGDGVPDLFTAPGPGGAPYVNILDGFTLARVRQVRVYGESFTLGVNLAVGDVLPDSPGVELLVAPEVGGAPYVNVFNPATGAFLKQILVYGETFTKGVRLAVGDVTGGAAEEVIVAPQAGGAPFVNVFDAATATRVGSLQAFGATFTGGLTVAAGDFDGSGKADIAVGPGARGAPFLNVFDGQTGARRGSYQAYGDGFTVGVRVGALDADGDGDDDLLAAPGRGGSPAVKVLDGRTGADLSGAGAFLAFEEAMAAGLFVTGARRG